MPSFSIKFAEAIELPRPAKEIKKQLAELANIKKEIEEYTPKDFAVEITRLSLCKEEDRLKEELLAAEMLESGNDMKLSLNGKAVRDCMVRADFIGSFLSDAQLLMERLTYTAKYGKPLTGERIPEEILSESELMYAGAKAASFKVILKMIPPDKVPMPTPDLYIVERRDKVLHGFQRLFDDRTSETELSDLLAPSEPDRYTTRIQTVEKNDATVQCRTISDPYAVSLTPKTAGIRNNWIEKPEQKNKEDLFDLTGYLVGGSLERHGWFDLRVGRQHYRGAVLRDALLQMRKIKLGAHVHARIKHIVEYKTKAALETPN